MNFISHQYCSPEPNNPWFTVGNCLPDMFKFTGKRVPKSHSCKVLSECVHDVQQMQAITRGMLNHICYDNAFHSSDYFTGKLVRLSDQISCRSLEIPRKDVFCHLLLEIAMDSMLNKEKPYLAQKITLAFEQVDLAYVLSELAGPYGIQPVMVKERIDNFLAKKYLQSYGTPKGIYDVFRRIYLRLFREDLLPLKENAMEVINLAFPLLKDHLEFLDCLFREFSADKDYYLSSPSS